MAKENFKTAKMNSIEVYGDEFGRDTILSRSARMRKFKFYQYKPIREVSTPTVNSIEPPVLLPREDILVGEQSEELKDIDREISELEKKISDLSSDGDDNLDEIFDLVNKKNDLLRRQMLLNIVEQEKVLEKANEELTKELRSLMSIEDSSKSTEQLERQQYLYDKSLALVNKRNELVLHMDVQERGIDDDNAVKAKLKNVIATRSSEQESCCII